MLIPEENHLLILNAKVPIDQAAGCSSKQNVVDFSPVCESLGIEGIWKVRPPKGQELVCYDPEEQHTRGLGRYEDFWYGTVS